MKIFNRSYLPETITYNKVEYKYNPSISGAMNANNTSLSFIQTQLRLQGKIAVLVNVLSRNLKGKTDLHSMPYNPTKHIFTSTI